MLIDVELHSGSTVLFLTNILVSEDGESSYLIDQPPHRLNIRIVQAVPLVVVTATVMTDRLQSARWWAPTRKIQSDWRSLDERWNDTPQRWNCRLRIRPA